MKIEEFRDVNLESKLGISRDSMFNIMRQRGIGNLISVQYGDKKKILGELVKPFDLYHVQGLVNDKGIGTMTAIMDICDVCGSTNTYCGFADTGYSNTDWFQYWHLCMDCLDIKHEEWYWSQIDFFGGLDYDCPFCDDITRTEKLKGILKA
jgi:hypothetical protein